MPTKNPTDDDYRNAAIIAHDCIITHNAEVLHTIDATYVKVWVRVTLATAQAVKEG